MITEEDLLILKELKKNARMATRDIAKNTNLGTTTVHRRLTRLIKDGVIRQFTIIPDWNKLDRGTLAYILIGVDSDQIREKNVRQADIAEQLKKHPLVYDSSTITGRKDMILKIRVKDTEELDKFIDYLRNVDGINQTETMVVLHESMKYDNPFDKVIF